MFNTKIIIYNYLQRTCCTKISLPCHKIGSTLLSKWMNGASNVANIERGFLTVLWPLLTTLKETESPSLLELSSAIVVWFLNLFPCRKQCCPSACPFLLPYGLFFLYLGCYLLFWNLEFNSGYLRFIWNLH